MNLTTIVFNLSFPNLFSTPEIVLVKNGSRDTVANFRFTKKNLSVGDFVQLFRVCKLLRGHTFHPQFSCCCPDDLQRFPSKKTPRVCDGVPDKAAICTRPHSIEPQVAIYSPYTVPFFR